MHCRASKERMRIPDSIDTTYARTGRRTSLPTATDGSGLPVLVEFGRTPKINKNGGRDHWPKVSCALMAGGGMRTGQVVGATNRLGEYATDRPIHFGDVHATLFHNLGIDPHRTWIKDLTGRPQHLLDPKYMPIRELV